MRRAFSFAAGSASMRSWPLANMTLPVSAIRWPAREPTTAGGAGDGAPPLIGAETGIALVDGLIELAQHRVERTCVVRRVANHDVQHQSGERAFRIVDVLRAVHRVDPRIQRGVLERDRHEA